MDKVREISMYDSDIGKALNELNFAFLDGGTPNDLIHRASEVIKEAVLIKEDQKAETCRNCGCCGNLGEEK